MNKIEGLHHIAICTSDMKAQIEYFTDVLGMELVALYWMHGVANTFHGFLRLNDESSIALVHNPDIDKIPVELGKTHAGNPGANCARGVMQHLALRVKNDEELLRDARSHPLERHTGARSDRSRLLQIDLLRRPRKSRARAVVVERRHRRARVDRPGSRRARTTSVRWNSRATRNRPTTRIRPAASSNPASTHRVRT